MKARNTRDINDWIQKTWHFEGKWVLITNDLVKYIIIKLHVSIKVLESGKRAERASELE